MQPDVTGSTTAATARERLAIMDRIETLSEVFTVLVAVGMRVEGQSGEVLACGAEGVRPAPPAVVRDGRSWLACGAPVPAPVGAAAPR